MTFRVRATGSGIWAGAAKRDEDGEIMFLGARHEVTDDVLSSAAIWLESMQEDYTVILPDREITISVTTKYTGRRSE